MSGNERNKKICPPARIGLEGEIVSLSQIRNAIEVLERQLSRELAMHRVRPIADQTTELWNIAIAKQQPKPDPISCISKFIDNGIGLPTFTVLNTYLKDCRKYGDIPDAKGIVKKIFPPGRKVNLSSIPTPTS